MLRKLLKRVLLVAGCVLACSGATQATVGNCDPGDTVVSIGYRDAVSWPGHTVQYAVCEMNGVDVYYTVILDVY